MIIIAVTFFAALGLDILTKQLALKYLLPNQYHVLWPKVLGLELTYNSGVAFGIDIGIANIIVPTLILSAAIIAIVFLRR